MINSQQTIEQLGGFGKLRAMINAKDFMESQDDSYLQFSHAKGTNKGVKVRIQLTGDLYTITWYKRARVEVMPGVKMTDFVECDSVEMIYGDQLREVFEGRTGLYLSI